MRIGDQIGAAYGEELNANIEKRFCQACVSRLHAPVPSDLAPPEEAAKTMMRQAGRVKTIPTRSVWDADSELKQRLEQLFLLFVRSLTGAHVDGPVVGTITLTPTTSLLVQMPNGQFLTLVGGEALGSFVWWQLTKDAAFMRRLTESFEAYAERVPFEDFRREFLIACIAGKACSTEDAIQVLDTLTRRYAEQYLS